MEQSQNKKNDIFENGSVWLRTDFHLHTIKDKEFTRINNENDFVKLFNGLYVYHHWQKRTETRKMENVLQRSALFIKTSWIDAFYKKSKSADI